MSGSGMVCASWRSPHSAAVDREEAGFHPQLAPCIAVASPYLAPRSRPVPGPKCMLIGVIADDFTGASDIANTLAKGLPGEGGLATAQFLGVPAADAPAEIEAGVVALKSRSIDAGEAVALSLAALD